MQRRGLKIEVDLMDPKNKVQWVYSAMDNQELAERYDQWAQDYDVDLERDFGYVGPVRTAEIFARHVPAEANVLDAGCGTGLVGEALYKMGYRNLAAIDLSNGMLKQARQKKIYRELHQMVLGEHLDFHSNSFDAVISVGVLTVGHAPASSLDELVRVTKIGGHVVFTLRPDIYEDAGFREKQEALDGTDWELVEVSAELQVLPKGEPEVNHQIWVYRVTR